MEISQAFPGLHHWLTSLSAEFAVHAAAHITTAIVGALVVIVGWRARRLPLHVLLKRSGLLTRAAPTNILFPHFPNPDVRVDGFIERLPTNVNLVGVLDSVAAFELHQSIKGLGTVARVDLMPHDQFAQRDRPFISVGGRSVNMIANEPVFPPVVEYPSHIAQIGENRYEAVIHNGRIAKDYGFIVLQRNPWNHDVRCCLVFGLYPQGSWAAAYALCHPVESGLLQQLAGTDSKLKIRLKCLLDRLGLKPFHELDTDATVVVATEVPTTALIPGRPRIVQVVRSKPSSKPP